jgi:drug/metabolite transporter (DMT)-like permease
MFSAGVLLSVLAALFFGISTAIQKYRIKEMKRFSLKRLVMDWTWRLSLLVGLFGIMTYIAALGYESISLVQPLVSVSILIPVFAGKMFFGEEIGAKWLHIIFILLGVVLLSV